MRPRASKGILLSAVVIGAAGWWWFGTGGEDKNAAPPPVQVSLATATLRDVPLEIREVGNVMAYETVAVRSRIDSQIAEVAFKDGQKVEKGDLLFVLDDRTLKADFGETEANVARDKAQYENLRRQYERTRDLTRQGFASKSELDDAKAAFEAQKATAGASEAAMENVRVTLGYTQITAPISGRTGTINVTVGNTVKANDTQPLVTINQIQPIRVQSALSQSHFDAMRKAMANGTVSVIATRDGSNIKSEGTIEYIDNGVDPTTGTFITRAVFPNSDEALWPGMFVNILVNLGTQPHVLTVPEVAIQHNQRGDVVFVIADGKAQKRDVKIARLQDNLAVIAEGLTDGEQVAIDGLLSLKDGTAVSVSTAPAPESSPESQP